MKIFSGTFQIKMRLFICLMGLVLIEPTWSITTTHHSTAPHRTSRITGNPPINLTLPLPERQKRLLPYYNFYLAQDINHPVVVRRYKIPHQHTLRPVQIKPRPGENFTPFLESNALPGPFIPIQKPTEQQQYRGDEDKVPNYSMIYDKLSQLKLVQRRPQQTYQSYHVIPDGRLQYAETDHNSIQQQQQPGKTIIQTYTPTEVEISNNHPLENEVYVNTAKPKGEIYITTARPQIEFNTSPKTRPYQLYNLVNQDHIQPLTIEEINQYEKDKNQFIDSKKPIIVYQQPEQIQRPIIFLPAYKENIEKPFIQQEQLSPPPKSPSSEKASLDALLKKLQASNTLPQTLTTDNIDNSIKTLVKILSNLKKQQKFTKPIVVADDSDYVEHTDNQENLDDGDEESQMYPPDTAEGGTPGRPGIDYPALSSIPQTSFNCKTQRYKGFFGDPDTNCQVWHYCDLNGGQASFLCPNGTIFSQVALTCDWWFNVKCSTTAQLYVLNERLYKYILPLAPKFPEDYSGPLVDKYLAIKFKEMEEKMKKQKKGKVDDKKIETQVVTTIDPNYMTKLEDAE